MHECFVCVYVSVFVLADMCVYLYMYLCIGMFCSHMHVCMCVFIFICVCVCVGQKCIWHMILCDQLYMCV